MHRLTRLLAAALLGVLAPAVAAQSLLAAFEPDVTEFTLDNGMTFIVATRHDAPVVTFFTYADVGSVDEPLGQTGVAHVFEHMAFKGTTTLGTRDLEAETAALAAEEAAYLRVRRAQSSGMPADSVAGYVSQFVALRDSAKAYVEDAAFDALLSRNGAVGMNATTSADRTAYFYSLPSNKVELWFHTESDRFQNPVLREFYQERDVVMEERRLRTESNPTGRLVEEFLAAAFKAHPYGQPTVGHMSDLQALSRTDAAAFFARYYAASNLTVAIVGDVQPDSVRALAERYFGSLPAASPPEPVRTVEPPQAGERRVTIVDHSQPFVLMGYHRPSGRDTDDAAYTVLADVLGAGRTSRFYRALEQPGLAVATQMLNSFPGVKYPTLFAMFLVPSPGVSPDSLEESAVEALEAVAADGITPAELDRAKTRARAGLIASLESGTGLAGALATAHVLDGDWRAVFRRLDAIEAVTAGDVQRVAAATFVPHNRTVATIRTATDS